MAAEMTDPTLDVPPPGEGPDDGIHRILVVADEKFRGRDFLDELRRHMRVAEAMVEIYIVAPALAHSAVDHEMANFDTPIVEAQERLDSIVAELKAVGLDAVGRVGDGDPVTAIGDGLREFPADELIVVSHVDGERAYAERDLWDRVQREYRLPISDIQVGRPDGEGAPEAVRIDHEPGKPHTEEEIIRQTRNFPPLQPRDTAGILIGLLGTFFLGLIAVLANSNEQGPIEGRNAAIILIAIGSFLLNAAHIVGLLFFQSVRYTGIWEKFMARLSLGFTTIGLIAALLLWLA